MITIEELIRHVEQAPVDPDGMPSPEEDGAPGLAEAYNPHQARDRTGKWTTGGGAGSTASGGARGSGLPDAPGEARIRAAEAKIAHNDYETAYIYNRNGQLKSNWGGGDREVQVPIEAHAKGDIVLHNHPTDRPASPDDIDNGVAMELSEIRTVGATTRCRVLPGPGQETFSAGDRMKFRSVFSRAYTDLGFAYLDRQPNGSEANRLWLRVTAQMGWRYSYGPRE